MPAALHRVRPAVLTLLLLAGRCPAAETLSVLVPVSGQFHEPVLVVPPQLRLSATPDGAGLQAQSFNLRLPAGQPFRLTLDAGQNAAGQQRRMVHGGDGTAFLPYELFQDAAGLQPWGEVGGAVPGTPLSGVGTGSDQSIPVWARLSQSLGGARPGDYHDALTVSISY